MALEPEPEPELDAEGNPVEPPKPEPEPEPELDADGNPIVAATIVASSAAHLILFYSLLRARPIPPRLSSLNFSWRRASG
jgi:hypothetical protein